MSYPVPVTGLVFLISQLKHVVPFCVLPTSHNLLYFRGKFLHIFKKKLVAVLIADTSTLKQQIKLVKRFTIMSILHHQYENFNFTKFHLRESVQS